MLAVAAIGIGATAAAVATLWSRKQKSKGSATECDDAKTVILQNRDGVEVHITPVGACIQRLIVPVQGKKVDIVLGHNKASTYAVSAHCRHLLNISSC